MLADLASGSGIAGHLTAGVSSIGAARAIQHWDVPEQQNEAKKALRSGSVDVLTLSCMTQPDEGIRKFAMLAVEHNPDVRITLQELWLPEDRFPFDPEHRLRTSVDEFDDTTLADLQKPHEEYFKVMEDYVGALNAEIGKQAVFIVPDAQATLALRAGIIAGTVPGLKKQSALFSDSWGHPTPPLRLLSAYCHFSVIYRRSPVGLPCPAVLTNSMPESVLLNLILQQLAWNAVAHHPLSGLGANGQRPAYGYEAGASGTVTPSPAP